jgi:hypothetical protein
LPPEEGYAVKEGYLSLGCIGGSNQRRQGGVDPETGPAARFSGAKDAHDWMFRLVDLGRENLWWLHGASSWLRSVARGRRTLLKAPGGAPPDYAAHFARV